MHVGTLSNNNTPNNVQWANGFQKREIARTILVRRASLVLADFVVEIGMQTARDGWCIF
jgi:hypothetical protein